MSEYVAEARFKLEEAKFFYEQMKLNFQDRTKFLYYLDAFLCSARSVTLVFQKARGKADDLMKWYNSKVEEWKNNKIINLFRELRNVSVHENVPETGTTSVITISSNAILTSAKAVIERISPDGKIERSETLPQMRTKQIKKEEHAPIKPQIVRYFFHELPNWFDENPDVMLLCRKYLDELDKFVTEAKERCERKEE